MFATPTPRAKRHPSHKFDHEEAHRAEIEERTHNGETCKQIADALLLRGISVSDKTISRKRLEWGLRKRAEPTSKGTKNPRLAVPRPERRQRPPDSQYVRPRNSQGTCSGWAKQLRRQIITERTQRGETAEQIAEFFRTQGYTFTSGASTVTRLQTFWKLIPYDSDRAQGKGKYSSNRKSRQKMKTTATTPAEATDQGSAGTLHYPSHCSFGPKRPGQGATSTQPFNVDGTPVSESDDNGDGGGGFADDDEVRDEDDDMAVAPSANADDDVEDQNNDARATPLARTPAPPSGPDPVALATELMSAEILIDPAMSTLEASRKYKSLLDACQLHRSASSDALLPSLAEIATAKLKVREAAAVVLDLTSDPPALAPS